LIERDNVVNLYLAKIIIQGPKFRITYPLKDD